MRSGTPLFFRSYSSSRNVYYWLVKLCRNTSIHVHPNHILPVIHQYTEIIKNSLGSYLAIDVLNNKSIRAKDYTL